MSITLQHLSYIHPDKEPLFENLNFYLEKGEKTALIGDNGSGKSTLLRIIAGQTPPSSGTLICSGQPYYVPQHFGQYDTYTIAQALGIDDKLSAFYAILQGDVTEENLRLLDEDWSIEEKAKEVLDRWQVPYTDLSQSIALLSGGEKTKVFLAGIDLHRPEIVLLDEPSNHLDRKGREKLYRFIQDTSATLVIVSHDRQLLNLLPTTTELTSRKLQLYGGNYDFYKEQKEKFIESIEEKLQSRSSQLHQTQQNARKLAERKQKQDVRGKQTKINKGTPRIMMKLLKDQAEKTTNKSQEQQADKVGQLTGEIRELRQTLARNAILKTNISSSNLHTGKILIDAEEINFAYDKEKLWKEPLTFQLCSGDRWQLEGDNGSGKTTLIRLLTGELTPLEGEIKSADFSFLYMDQQYSLLDNNSTVLQQVQEFNHRKLSETELKTILNRYLFPAKVWDKPIVQLSGGEKMRLILCCLQVSEQAPDLFILDEPTNNLDIRSMEILSYTLRSFQGALLVVSHDQVFKEEIGIDKTIRL